MWLRSIMSGTVKKVPIPARGVDYRGKVVLAPMVRSGELPTRLLALKYGADLVWGPETVDRAIISSTRKVNQTTGCIEWFRNQTHGPKEPLPPEATTDSKNLLYVIDPVREANRLVFQIGTADPERAVAAARLVAGDVAGIDVNAGCPKPFSTSGGMGAALLRTPDRLVAILEALVRTIQPEFGIGISVKIRILETAAETEALVRRLVATGITGLTVHCRTTPMRPRERAVRGQLRMVADVCRDAGVACLMNGDVASRDEALRLAAEFGADGAMIATAAETNPSCFRTDADGGLVPWPDLVDEYLATALTVANRFGNSKYLLSQMVPGKEDAHKTLMQTCSYAELCDSMGLPHLLERARLVDELCGPRKLTKKQRQRQKQKSMNATALAADGQMGHSRALSKAKKALSDRSTNPAAGNEKASVASFV